VSRWPAAATNTFLLGLRFSGFGWATTPAASQQVDAIIELRPVQGAANPSSKLVIATQINGGGYTDRFTMTDTGNVVINGNAAALSPKAGAIFQCGQVDGTSCQACIDSFAANAAFNFRRANNTAASPSPLVSGDQIGSFGAIGYQTGGYWGNPTAAVKFFAAENWGATVGTYITFSTTAIGATNLVEAMRIQASGGVSIGTTTDPGSGNFKLSGGVVGTTTNTARAGGLNGEIQESIIAVGSAVSLVTATAKTVTSITLGAGNWVIYGNVKYTLATTTGTQYAAGACATTNTLPNTENYASTPLVTTLLSETVGQVIPTIRVSIASSTTYYLVAQATFTAGTVAAYGRISALRTD
jgi:hypothetical protein